MASVATLRHPSAAAALSADRKRRTRGSRNHVLTETAVGGIAGVLVLALVLSGVGYGVRLAWLSSGSARGGVGISAPATEAAPEPGQLRLARIVVPLDDGRCREHSFSNVTGMFGLDRIVSCGEPPQRAARSGTGTSFESFKQAFRK